MLINPIIKTMAAVALVAMLGACSTTAPVARNFPGIPDTLNKDCVTLQPVGTPNVKLSEMLTVVTSNYEKYHECAIKVESWREWYNEQKRVFDGVK